MTTLTMTPRRPRVAVWAPCLALAGACIAPSGEDAEVASDTAAVTRRAGTTRTAARPTVKVRGLPTLARPCRADSLSVDVPLQWGTPWTDLSFVPALVADLEHRIDVGDQAWFCASPNCLQEAVRVDVTSVLPPRAELHRAEGHLRFLRVRFYGARSRRALRLREGRECAAVSALRDAVGHAAGVPTDTYWVGRECDAQAASLESQPTAGMLRWHLNALGLPPSALTLPAGGSAPVDLVLADSGVLPSVAAATSVATSYDAARTPGLHAHGSGMAILARQVAPQVSLHDVRVLEAGGAGTSEAVARGLDHAVFATPSSRPLVLNLSLGWPAELSRTARIQGGTCQSHEDPFGEAVRYVLDVARRYDAEGHRRVFISAAAGNRPREVPAGLFPAPPAGHVEMTCTPPPTGPALFFPGEYARIDSCRASGPDLRLTHATSAIGAARRPAVTSIPMAETPLVAPGELVMASGPGAATAPVCSTGQSFPPPVTLPAAFTGSSVAAALVSAAAARVQRRRIEAGAWALDQGAIERLLYLTGEALCRTTASGDPVRALHVGRLDRAIDPDGCRELVGCVADVTETGAALLARCGPALVACGLEDGDEAGNLAPGCTPPGPVSMGPPQGYQPASCALARAGSPAILERASCSPACPDDSGRSPDLLGSIGPQPDAGGCPWCLLEWGGPGASQPSMGYFELNPAFEPGTSITDPWLVLKGVSTTTSQPKSYFVDLKTVTQAADWYPGATVKVQMNLAGVDLDPTTMEASLQTQIATPDAKYPATDVSPLATKLAP